VIQLTTIFDDVADFHEKGETEFRAEVGMPDPHSLAHVLSLIAEEYSEMNLAAQEENLPAYVDGLLDLMYTAVQGLLAAGLHPGEAHALWMDVQRANMSKVEGPLLEANGGNPYRTSTGKITKPPGFTPPDIEGTLHTIRRLRREGWDSWEKAPASVTAPEEPSGE